MARTQHTDGPGREAQLVDPERAGLARRQLPERSELALLADVLSLLGDPTRLSLLLALRTADELCVGDLAAVVGQSESGVSHALRLLRAHRVVAVRRAARLAFYRLADDHVRELLDVALAHHGHVTVMHLDHDAPEGRRT